MIRTVDIQKTPIMKDVAIISICVTVEGAEHIEQMADDARQWGVGIYWGCPSRMDAESKKNLSIEDWRSRIFCRTKQGGLTMSNTGNQELRIDKQREALVDVCMAASVKRMETLRADQQAYADWCEANETLRQYDCAKHGNTSEVPSCRK
jgi:hypothetical protein